MEAISAGPLASGDAREYSKPPKAPRRFRSFVWNFFEREAPISGQASGSAKCTICFKKIKTSDASTTGLRSHLSNAHKINEKTAVNISNGVNEDLTLLNTSQTFPTSEIIARVVSETFITFDQLSSPVLRGVFTRAGHNLPSDAEGMCDQFLREFQSNCAVLGSIFESALKENQRFSVSVDASPLFSSRGKLYLSVNIHLSQSHFCLGTLRISSTMSSTKILELVQERLSIFGLNLDNHVTCLVFGGSTLIKNFTENTSSLNQQCIMHGTNLAIREILYEKKELLAVVNVEPDGDELVGENNSHEHDWDEESSEPSTDYFPYPSKVFKDYSLKPDILALVDQVGQSVRLLKSPHSRSENILQPFIEENFYKERAILLECPGNWSSLVKMLQSFVDISHTANSAYGTGISIDSSKLKRMEELRNALKPIDHMLMMMSREDASLAKTDQLVKFTLTMLETQATPISNELKTAIRARYLERRNTVVIQLQNLLENPNYLKKKNDLFGFKITKESLVHCADQLLKRLYPSSDRSSAAPPTSFTTNSASNDLCEIDVSVAGSYNSPMTMSTSQTFEESFNEWVNNQEHQRQTYTVFDTLTEGLVNDYLATRQLPDMLSHLKTSLLTIKPTSVECEKNFSELERNVGKDRSSLNDTAIDALMFLRKYYSVYKVFNTGNTKCFG